MFNSCKLSFGPLQLGNYNNPFITPMNAQLSDLVLLAKQVLEIFIQELHKTALKIITDFFHCIYFYFCKFWTGLAMCSCTPFLLLPFKSSKDYFFHQWFWNCCTCIILISDHSVSCLSKLYVCLFLFCFVFLHKDTHIPISKWKNKRKDCPHN